MNVRDHMILRLAATPYRSPGRRLDDALELVGLRPTPFWAAADRLLDHPDALAAYPADVHRLRRLRDVRRAHRQRGAESGAPSRYGPLDTATNQPPTTRP